MEIERDKGERKSRRRKRMKRKRTRAVGEARGRNKEDERKKGRESHIKMIRQLPHNNCSSYSFTQCHYFSQENQKIFYIACQAKSTFWKIALHRDNLIKESSRKIGKMVKLVPRSFDPSLGFELFGFLLLHYEFLLEIFPQLGI